MTEKQCKMFLVSGKFVIFRNIDLIVVMDRFEWSDAGLKLGEKLVHKQEDVKLYDGDSGVRCARSFIFFHLTKP